MPQLILCLTKYERQIMKIQNVIFATAMSGMMTLCSCSKEVMNDNRMEYDSRLTVLTRSDGENGDKVIATPVRIYVFNSEEQCVTTKTQDGVDPTFSVELPEGEYDIYAIGGADEDCLVLPTLENAEKTSVISLKEGEMFGDLMTAHSSVTLTKGSSNTTTMEMKRNVCQIVSITITGVPEEAEVVSVSIAPFYDSILLDGTYQGESGKCTIPLEKQGDGSTWKNDAANIYLLPSVGKPTISIMIDDSTYSYLCEKELSANRRISIDGTYTNVGVVFTGTITGIAWDEEETVSFNFTDDDLVTTNNNEEVINVTIPEIGSLYEGCYVLAVNGKQVTILSSIEENKIIKYDDTREVKEQKINNKLHNWSVPNVTATWELPSEAIINILNNEKSHITSPTLGSKSYFCYTNSKIMAFTIKDSGVEYSSSITNNEYLCPVATLTFN